MTDTIRNDAMQIYQPRVFPRDTPTEAAARVEGFEAGRQYEASLRQDNPATLIPAAEFAALDPFVGCECHCSFCQEPKSKPHAPTCLWVRCGG